MVTTKDLTTFGLVVLLVGLAAAMVWAAILHGIAAVIAALHCS